MTWGDIIPSQILDLFDWTDWTPHTDRATQGGTNTSTFNDPEVRTDTKPVAADELNPNWILIFGLTLIILAISVTYIETK